MNPDFFLALRLQLDLHQTQGDPIDTCPTLRLSRCRKRERGTSGRWRQSAAGDGSVASWLGPEAGQPTILGWRTKSWPGATACNNSVSLSNVGTEVPRSYRA